MSTRVPRQIAASEVKRIDVVVVGEPSVRVVSVGMQGPPGAQGQKGDPGEIGGAVPWENITGKPLAFPPEAHTHAGLYDPLGEADAAVADHEAAPNPHPQYAQEAAVATALGGKVDSIVGKGLSTEDYSTAEKTKLAGIAESANNYTHPATHPATMIDQDATHRFVSDTEKAAWNGKQDALGFTPENSANKGAANGYTPLGADIKVPAIYLPSFVDDVVEAANFAVLPGTGETGKIYVTLDTNKTYRWSGSAYVEISPSPGSTDAVPEGASNLYFTAARVLASVLTGLSTATNAVITASDTVLSALGKLQKQITDNLATLTGHTGNTSNPHGVTKAQVGLGNADDTSDANKPISTATQAALGGFKNAVYNGDFSVNQLGVSGTVTLAANTYGHDGWKAGASGCTYTFSKTNGLTTITISSGSLQQIIEALYVPTGTNTCVMSWTGTAQGKIGAGSYGASGITASVTGGSNLTVEFNAGTLTKVQFEKGVTATPYEQKDELPRCLRRWVELKSFQGASNATTNSIAVAALPVPFGTLTPTVTLIGTMASQPGGYTTTVVANYNMYTPTAIVMNLTSSGLTPFQSYVWLGGTVVIDGRL